MTREDKVECTLSLIWFMERRICFRVLLASSLISSSSMIHLRISVLISVSDRDKGELIEVAKGLYDCGFKIIATGSTYDRIVEAGMNAVKIAKINEGRPNILDAITNKEIDLILNTPIGKKGSVDDSYIRKAAIKGKIPYMTTMAAAKATVAGIQSMRKGEGQPVKSLQEYHANIKDAE